MATRGPDAQKLQEMQKQLDKLIAQDNERQMQLRQHHLNHYPHYIGERDSLLTGTLIAIGSGLCIGMAKSCWECIRRSR